MEFKSHLDNLAKLLLYGLVQKGVNNCQACVLERGADSEMEVDKETEEGKEEMGTAAEEQVETVVEASLGDC